MITNLQGVLHIGAYIVLLPIAYCCLFYILYPYPISDMRGAVEKALCISLLTKSADRVTRQLPTLQCILVFQHFAFFVIQKCTESKMSRLAAEGGHCSNGVPQGPFL